MKIIKILKTDIPLLSALMFYIFRKDLDKCIQIIEYYSKIS